MCANVAVKMHKNQQNRNKTEGEQKNNRSKPSKMARQQHGSIILQEAPMKDMKD